MISFLIHYRWLVHILCFGCIFFFSFFSLSVWNGWIVQHVGGLVEFCWFYLVKVSHFVFIWYFWSGYSLVVFWFCTEVRVYSAISLKLRHVQWKTRRAGQEILPRPLFLIYVKDASKIKPLVMSTRDALPQCLFGAIMVLSCLKPQSFLGTVTKCYKLQPRSHIIEIY